jgi:putative DNA primase/helicase
MDATERCHQFLTAIFEPEDIIEFRPLPPPKHKWGSLADLPQIVAWLERLNASKHNAYFGANPRKESGASDAAGVLLARCLFADFDGGVLWEEALERIKAAGLPMPTAINHSGNGTHSWWRLSQPITDAGEWTRRQKQLAAAIGSDQVVTDWPRIMRLPGFINHKYPHKPMAELIDCDPSRVYTLEQLTPKPSERQRMGITARDFIERGTILPAGRHHTMFHAACDLGRNGWSKSETVNTLMQRMRKWNDIPDIEDCPRQIGNGWNRGAEERTNGPAPSITPVDQSPAPEWTPDGEPPARLVLVRASEIECTAINWLWPQRIVGDGLTIITGPVGISKSLISVDVAARVTTAGKWPDGTGHAPLGSVILFGAEDDPGKVVVPRLMAAGADLNRVHVCQGTTNGRNDDEPAAVVLERHIGQLRDALDAVEDCRLIVFDPLPDYIAADENKSSEVRYALVPLARLAQEKNVAIVAVLHQNKKNDLTTVQRIAGSGAFAQIARIVLSIGTHPEDAGKATGKRRVMLVSKNNYGERDVGQAYEIETRSSGEPGLCWLPGTLAMDADEISRRPTGGREHEDRRGEAVDALREMLGLGERNAGATIEELQDRGFGRRQIDHASGALNVIKRKMRDGWYWRLPAREPGQGARPEPEQAFAAWAPD